MCYIGSARLLYCRGEGGPAKKIQKIVTSILSDYAEKWGIWKPQFLLLPFSQLHLDVNLL